MKHPHVDRYAAPVAFLLAVTVAVLLVRSALHHGTTPAATRSTTTQTTRTTHRKQRKHRHHRVVHTYTVQSGDTLASIAAKEGTTASRLEQLNPKVNPTALQVGQTIRVR